MVGINLSEHSVPYIVSTYSTLHLLPTLPAYVHLIVSFPLILLSTSLQPSPLLFGMFSLLIVQIFSGVVDC